MSAYRFDVEFIYNKDNIDIHSRKDNLVKNVSTYIIRNTDYNPIINSEFQQAKEKNQYHSSYINNSIRISIKLILSENDVDDTFHPELLQRNIDEEFSSRNDNYKRTEYRTITSI